ncbi:MAG: polysaccharide biosynthesis protein [Alistipes sp.]|nr:polysaccharide biosynthesis protein [Alistipes sp.]
MLEKLAKQTAIYGISTILGRFLSYLLTPFYTRIFGVESYGVITDVYALIPFALVTLTLGMESAYFRFAAKAEAAGGDVEGAKRRLFSTMWGITSLASLLFFAVVTLFREEVSVLMGEVYAANPAYVVIVAAIVMFDVMGCIPFSRLREQGRALRFVTLKLLNIILQVGLAVLFWAVGLFDTPFGVGWAFVANLLASIITSTIVMAMGGTLPRIRWSMLAILFAYSLPLLLSSIAGTAGEFIDRQLIKYLVPEGAMAQLGIYGAITKIAVVMTLFTQMYRLAAEPFFLANYRKEEFVEMNAAALKYYMIASMLIFLGIALYRDLFALIVGTEFRQGIYILPVVLGANILSGVWLNLSFWYKREEKTRYALWVTLSGLAASIIAGCILIPRAGYYGAAWSRFIAEVVMVAVSLTMNRICYPTPYDFRRIGEYVAVGVAIFLLAEALPMQNAIVQYTLSTLLFVTYAVYVVRREKIDVHGLLRSVLKRR